MARRPVALPQWCGDEDKLRAFVSACRDDCSTETVGRVVGVSNIGQQMTRLRTALTRREGSDRAIAPCCREIAVKLVALYDGRNIARVGRGFLPDEDRRQACLAIIDDEAGA